MKVRVSGRLLFGIMARVAVTALIVLVVACSGSNVTQNIVGSSSGGGSAPAERPAGSGTTSDNDNDDDSDETTTTGSTTSSNMVGTRYKISGRTPDRFTYRVEVMEGKGFVNDNATSMIVTGDFNGDDTDDVLNFAQEPGSSNGILYKAYVALSNRNIFLRTCSVEQLSNENADLFSDQIPWTTLDTADTFFPLVDDFSGDGEEDLILVGANNNITLIYPSYESRSVLTDYYYPNYTWLNNVVNSNGFVLFMNSNAITIDPDDVFVAGRFQNRNTATLLHIVSSDNANFYSISYDGISNSNLWFNFSNYFTMNQNFIMVADVDGDDYEELLTVKSSVDSGVYVLLQRNHNTSAYITPYQAGAFTGASSNSDRYFSGDYTCDGIPDVARVSQWAATNANIYVAVGSNNDNVYKLASETLWYQDFILDNANPVDLNLFSSGNYDKYYCSAISYMGQNQKIILYPRHDDIGAYSDITPVVIPEIFPTGGNIYRELLSGKFLDGTTSEIGFMNYNNASGGVDVVISDYYNGTFLHTLNDINDSSKGYKTWYEGMNKNYTLVDDFDLDGRDEILAIVNTSSSSNLAVYDVDSYSARLNKTLATGDVDFTTYDLNNYNHVFLSGKNSSDAGPSLIQVTVTEGNTNSPVLIYPSNLGTNGNDIDTLYFSNPSVGLYDFAHSYTYGADTASDIVLGGKFDGENFSILRVVPSLSNTNDNIFVSTLSSSGFSSPVLWGVISPSKSQDNFYTYQYAGCNLKTGPWDGVCNFIRVGDPNCDGKDDLIILDASTTTGNKLYVKLSTGSSFEAKQTWSDVYKRTGITPPGNTYFEPIDFYGRGCNHGFVLTNFSTSPLYIGY